MFLNTLTGRILGLTILFVVIAEVLILVPAVARYRESYLQNRLDIAQLAALVRLAAPDEEVAPELESELLQTADVLTVSLRRSEVRELALTVAKPPQVKAKYDITDPGLVTSIRGALRVLVTPGDRIIQVVGRTQRGESVGIEITMHEAPLRKAMIDYASGILYVSMAISAGVAALLFFSVQWLIVRPIRRVVDNMAAYRDSPEDAGRFITPRSGARELRLAETALHDLQVRLTASLRQKERLAALGGGGREDQSRPAESVDHGAASGGSDRGEPGSRGQADCSETSEFAQPGDHAL